MLAGLITGNQTRQTWYAKNSPWIFLIQRALEDLLEGLGIKEVIFTRIDEAACPYFESGYGAVIHKQGDIGVLGKTESPGIESFGLKQDAYVFELDLSAVMTHMPDQIGQTLCRDILPFPRCDPDRGPADSVGDVMGQMKTIAEKRISGGRHVFV